MLKALHRLLAEAGDGGANAVTSVRRQKMTLRLAMAVLWNRVRACGPEGILLEECLSRPLVRLEIVMTFLALLELLRQGRVEARQAGHLDGIVLSPALSAREADAVA